MCHRWVAVPLISTRTDKTSRLVHPSPSLATDPWLCTDGEVENGTLSTLSSSSSLSHSFSWSDRSPVSSSSSSSSSKASAYCLRICKSTKTFQNEGFLIVFFFLHLIIFFNFYFHTSHTRQLYLTLRALFKPPSANGHFNGCFHHPLAMEAD